MQLVPRLYDGGSSGSLKVGGVDVRDYDLEALRDQVAMVLQKNVLFLRHHRENSGGATRTPLTRRSHHAAQLAQADGFVQEFPDKYDTYIEQGGTNDLRRPAPAPVRPRAAEEAEDPHLDDSTSAVDTKTTS